MLGYRERGVFATSMCFNWRRERERDKEDGGYVYLFSSFVDELDWFHWVMADACDSSDGGLCGDKGEPHACMYHTVHTYIQQGMEFSRLLVELLYVDYNTDVRFWA
jgi:hypothetical protein